MLCKFVGSSGGGQWAFQLLCSNPACRRSDSISTSRVGIANIRQLGRAARNFAAQGWIVENAPSLPEVRQVEVNAGFWPVYRCCVREWFSPLADFYLRPPIKRRLDSAPNNSLVRNGVNTHRVCFGATVHAAGRACRKSGAMRAFFAQRLRFEGRILYR